MLRRQSFQPFHKLATVLCLTLFFAALCAGCGIKSGVEETVVPGHGRDFDMSRLQESKVLFRAFEHQGVVARSTAVATGPGGTATAHGETVGRSEAVPMWTATRKVKYVSNIWWAMSHGGAHGSGFEKEYRAYLHDIFEEIGTEMRKQMTG